MMERILRYLPPYIRQALQKLPSNQQKQIQEIRLRTERHIGLTIWNQEQFLTSSGEKTTDAALGIRTSQKQLLETFQAICEYSVYRYTREIYDGFLTVDGGNRVSIAGTAVYKNGVRTGTHHISSLNFRIAHGILNCAKDIYWHSFQPKPCSMLFIGSVGSGKTTMLRDFCRLAGNQYRVSLVDERSEIAAMHSSVPRFDIGLHTDVLDGYLRAEGLLTALRVLTPQVLLCDEIGTEADAKAILQIHGCGVPIVATAHSTSLEDLTRRQVLHQLLQNHVFEKVILLSGHGESYQIFPI